MMTPESPKSFHKDGDQLDMFLPSEIAKEVNKYNIDESLLYKINREWYSCGMPIEEFIKERAEIAKKYNDIDEKLFSKVDGNWLACGMPIEEFIKERASLAEKLKLLDPKQLTKKGDEWHVGSISARNYFRIHSGKDEYWK